MKDLRCQNTLMMLGLLGFAVLYVLRVNLSMAIVAMVDPSKESKFDGVFEESCPIIQTTKTTNDPENRLNPQTTFLDWNEKAQGRILASFFYGYTLTNFIGGRLADKFGGKRVYGGGVLLTSLLAFFLPLASRHSENAFVCVRLLQGMTEGVTFPSMNTLMSNWVQPSRRSLFMSRIAGGTLLGTIFTLSTGGWLAQSTYGWVSIFYSSGVIGLLYCVAWFSLVADHPRDHPGASEQEKALIRGEIGEHKGEAGPVPWSSLLSSPPFLATVVAHFGCNFGFYCLLTELPTYLSSVHHFDIKNNGLISSLPYVVMWLVSVLYANRIHTLTIERKISLSRTRKISTAIAMFCPMFFLACISGAGCHSAVAVAIICLAVGLSGVSQCGFLCGFQDLAPNYSGTLSGISNTVATVPGFVAPLVTGAIIRGQPTISQWNKVFCLTSFVYGVSCLVYLSFMSAQVQPWNHSGGQSTGDKKQAHLPLIREKGKGGIVKVV